MTIAAPVPVQVTQRAGLPAAPAKLQVRDLNFFYGSFHAFRLIVIVRYWLNFLQLVRYLF